MIMVSHLELASFLVLAERLSQRNGRVHGQVLPPTMIKSNVDDSIVKSANRETAWSKDDKDLGGIGSYNISVLGSVHRYCGKYAKGDGNHDLLNIRSKPVRVGLYPPPNAGQRWFTLRP
jgi:hypothetical protein